MNNKKQIVRSVLLVFFTLLVFSHVAHKTGLAEDKDVIMEKDIIYGKGGDVELKLDLARPTTGKGPFPALIFLFGGGYRMESKKQFRREIREAAQRGYVAVTIDYRLTNVKENDKPKYIFPSQVYDAKCAVRWLRANARKYKIDKNHMGVVGFSSGANLALMLGVTDSSVGLEGDCGKMKYSSRVQAVVNLAGGTDMVMQYQIRRYYIEPYMGGNPDNLPEQYRLATPITHISKNDPPVLSMYGDMEPGLPQAEILNAKMKEMGVSHTLIIIEKKGHGAWANFSEDGPLWNFFEEHLKGD